MHKTEYVLGVDVGTSGVKVMAFSLSGKQLRHKKQHYNVLPSPTGYMEHDPEMICQYTITTITDLVSEMGRAPEAIGFCTFMHSIMALDQHFNPIGNLQLWNDNRSAAAATLLKNSPEGSSIYRCTGTPLHPMSPLTKIRQMRDTDGRVFSSTKCFAGIKEYLMYRLTGRMVLDYSTASATGLFDSVNKRWCEKAMQWSGITADYLAEIIPPGEYLRCTLEGLLKNVVIVPGLSDGVAANLGAANIDDTEFTLTLGTSAALRFTGQAMRIDPEGVLFSYCLDDILYVTGGASNNCFNVIDKLVTEFGFSLDILNDSAILGIEAATAASPLFYLPWMFGERAPLQLHEPLHRFIPHQPANSTARKLKGAVESILFNLRHIAEKLGRLNGKRFACLHLSGGLAQFDLVRDLTAAIFDLPLVEHSTGESSALGTAFFAAHNIGAVKNYNEIRNWNPVIARHTANPRMVSSYNRAYEYYQAIVQQELPQRLPS
jgi:gluconokinase